MSRALPFALFLFGAVFVFFAAGLFVAEYKVPPYHFVMRGAKTLYYGVNSWTAAPYAGQFQNRPTGVPLDRVASARLTPTPEAGSYPEDFLVNGGLNEYLDLCPGDGCVGVRINRAGEVLHAYPYRPDEILAADVTGGSYYREGVPADPRLIFRPLGLLPYDGGDLMITFQSVGNMFPFSSGVARIDPEGHPRWFRFDYSHHWATMLPDGRALVPDLVLADGDWRVPMGPRKSAVTLACETGKPEIDGIQIVTPDGRIERRHDIAGALLASPFSAMLAETTHACDPLHINYVDVLDDSAPGGALQPGSWIISMRNLSAIAVYDPETERVTKVVRGGFVQQHSVHHLGGSKAVLFDNWGGDTEVGGVSRVLEVDLATGEERRIFPQPGTPEGEAGLFSDRGSFLTVSPDRSRILVSYSGEGRAYEIDAATGRRILSYDSLHDISGLKAATAAQKGEAARSNLYGMLYVED